MQQEFIITIGIILTGFAGILWFLHTKLKQLEKNKNDDQMLEDIVNKVFGQSIDHITKQSKQVLEGEKETIQTDLNNKQKSIEKLVKDLQKEIDSRQEEIRHLERDRNKIFSSLREALENQQELTKDLKTTTDALSRVLSNNQQRGAWGERIIEDLLNSAGLSEGVHYVKQSKLGNSTARPDITILLPNKRVVPVDVKFPYASITKMAEAKTKTEKKTHAKQFSQDVKTKIKKVAEYIKPEEDTLDYAILFVPNEMVFSFINQKFPELVDEAISQRVMIVSPFTFLIVARTVMESYRNFMMENNMRTITKYVQQFSEEWGRFTTEFEKVGNTIDRAHDAYQKIATTRYNRMQLRIDRIEEERGKQNQQNLLEG